MRGVPKRQPQLASRLPQRTIMNTRQAKAMDDDYERDDGIDQDTANGPVKADRAAFGAKGAGDRADIDAGAKPVPDETVITPEDIQSELENLQRDLATTNDRYLRLAAEFDNYRKRVERERSELHERAQADLAKRLLDVVDDLARVAEQDEDTPAKALLDGTRLVEKKMMHVLETLGLQRLDPEGELFDPAVMEAIAMVDAEHPEEDEVVSDVYQVGYTFKGQLLRPARVRVKRFEA